MTNLTDEQRERFRAMRQQRQAEDAETAETPTPATQDAPTQKSEEPAIAKAEEEAEESGGLFGSFFEEIPAEEPPTEVQPAQPEDPKMPFLKPGMNASVQISAVNKIGILTLPVEAVLDMRGRKMVRIIGAEGQPERPQPVVTGVSSYDKIEIISGLAEGDVVAIGGFAPGEGGSRAAEWRQRMMNPASTMRRMTGGGRRGR